MNEKEQVKTENLECTENMDSIATPNVTSRKEGSNKRSQIPWVALAFFAASAVSLVVTIVKFFQKYNIEKKAYDILVGTGLSQKMIDAITNGKTPISYAFDALLKSPFPYIAIIAQLSISHIS